MKRFITFGTLMVMILLLLSMTSTAVAQQDPCNGATLSIDPTSGLAGSSVAVSGTGIATWAPEYDLYWDSAMNLLTSGTADPTGAFATNVTIPADATAGDHLIILSATAPNEGQIVCAQTFTVTEPPPPAVVENAYPAPVTTTPPVLPSTGAFLLPAAGLLVAGAGALLSRRRRS